MFNWNWGLMKLWRCDRKVWWKGNRLKLQVDKMLWRVNFYWKQRCFCKVRFDYTMSWSKLWFNEKCTIEIGGSRNCGYVVEQVDEKACETSNRLNVMAGKLQLKAKMCLQSAIWWHNELTKLWVNEKIYNWNWGIIKLGICDRTGWQIGRWVKLQVD